MKKQIKRCENLDHSSVKSMYDILQDFKSLQVLHLSVHE